MRSNAEIIELMKQLCAEKKISINELAKRTGMAKSAISRYFNFTRNFPLNRAEQFASALGVTSEYLLGVKPIDEPASTVSGYSETDLRKLAESAKTFDGKPLTESDIQAIQNIIEIYLQGRL
jgi:transcriptional regulator, cro/CI family|nr:MAG TPA: repressor protein [Caudoviricetes sp.]